jgi:hypothetical protein
MDGTGLLRVLIEATGLPPAAVENELQRLLAARGLDAARVTLEDLREVLAAYLQETLVEAKDSVAAT